MIYLVGSRCEVISDTCFGISMYDHFTSRWNLIGVPEPVVHMQNKVYVLFLWRTLSFKMRFLEGSYVYVIAIKLSGNQRCLAMWPYRVFQI